MSDAPVLLQGSLRQPIRFHKPYSAVDFVEVVQSLSEEDCAHAVWRISYSDLREIRTMQAYDGEYLWRSNAAYGGKGERLLGIPIVRTDDNAGLLLEFRALPSEPKDAQPIMRLTPDEQQRLLTALEHKRIGARLLELLTHGWGHLDIVVAEHRILKSHLTKTDV